jgi:hypothetical protein
VHFVPQQKTEVSIGKILSGPSENSWPRNAEGWTPTSGLVISLSVATVKTNAAFERMPERRIEFYLFG